MKYQEFKKNVMPILDKKMGEIGFVREKTKSPIYCKYPHKDDRLVWVVCFNFSGWDNPYFGVLITPYWIPSQHKDESFPRGVGYLGGLSPNGFQHGGHVWNTKSVEEATKSVQEVIDALAGPGFDWFKQFSTPLKLLKKNPSAKLASDLEKYELAVTLYNKQLKSSFSDLLLHKKTNHLKPYDSVKDWQRDRHERVMKEYRDTLLKTGLNANDCELRIMLVELDSLLDDQEEYAKDVAKDPNSRWFKNQLKYCSRRIEELNNEMAL